MKKTVGFFLVLICALMTSNIYADFNVNKLTSLKEADIDLADVSLQMAKEVYSGLDVNKYQNQLNFMASEIRLKTRGITDPEFRIRVINTYLYKEIGFQYDLDDPRVMNPDNRYLNGLLDTKKGSCITLPLLYVVLGQKLGYPIYPVLVPEHYFVRYVDPKLADQNIEATGKGSYTPDSFYIKDLKISKVGIKNGAYLKTLSYKEYISELLALNSLFHFRDKKNYTKGFKYIDIAIKLRSITPELYRQKGGMSFYLSQKYAKESNLKLSQFYWAQADKMGRKAEKLGFVKLSDQEYLKSIEAKKLALKK